MKNTSKITQTADRPGTLMVLARDFLFSGAGSNLGGTGLKLGSVGQKQILEASVRNKYFQDYLDS